MIEKICDRLLTVKSIVTIILTVVFAVLVIRDGDVPPTFTTIYSAVMGFYFGIQTLKKEV